MSCSIDPEFLYFDQDTKLFRTTEDIGIDTQYYTRDPETDEFVEASSKRILGGKTRKGRKSRNGRTVKFHRGGVGKKPVGEKSVAKSVRAKSAGAKSVAKSAGAEEKLVKIRKNCDANAGEMLVIIVLVKGSEYCNTTETPTVTGLHIAINNEITALLDDGPTTAYQARAGGYGMYIADMRTRTTKQLQDYSKTFADSLINNFGGIAGFRSITDCKLNGKGCDKGDKADVQARFNGDLQKFSVKWCKNATQTNYSMYTLLTEVNERKIEANGYIDSLKATKRAVAATYTAENMPIITTMLTPAENTVQIKDQIRANRKPLNALYYVPRGGIPVEGGPPGMHYWRLMSSAINSFNAPLAMLCAKYIYPIDDTNPMWEFNGSTLKNLNLNRVFSDMTPPVLLATNDYYTGGNAKIFYHLVVTFSDGAVTTHKIEIRFKSGNMCDGTAPQMMAYPMDV